MARRHVILVGLPGSGKTSAGREAAALLEAPFIDLDDRIRLRAGKSIRAIFRDEGEAGFRRLESETGVAAFAEPASVIATGGGFMMDHERRQQALDAGLTIYLRTTPEVAARRLGAQGLEERPLLAGVDTAQILGDLLTVRGPSYLLAEQSLITDHLSVAMTAASIVALARDRGHW